MKRYPCVIAVAALSCRLLAGELSLFECYRKAEQSHPLQMEWKNRQKIYDLKRRNLNAAWLPSLDANASAVHLSNVAGFDQVLNALPVAVSIESLPAMPKDQYKITLDLKQTLYDGGMISAAKQAEKAALQADLQGLKSEFYKVRDQINQIYFALLMIQKQSELAVIYQDEILERRVALQSGVQNGVILPANVDILDAELLKIEQQMAELEIQRNKAGQILTELTGENTADAVLFPPAVEMPAESDIRRPEVALFEIQKTVLEMNKKAVLAQRRPKAAAFGTYGYGQPPGNDFFNEKFDTYYTFGAGVNWTLFNWNITKRTLQSLQAQQSVVEAREENFKKQIRIALTSGRAEIERFQILIEGDQKLMELREKIKQAAASRLTNGTLSATEFLTELNASREARINYEMHQIQRVQAQVVYLTISGQIDY